MSVLLVKNTCEPTHVLLSIPQSIGDSFTCHPFPERPMSTLTVLRILCIQTLLRMDILVLSGFPLMCLITPFLPCDCSVQMITSSLRIVLITWGNCSFLSKSTLMSHPCAFVDWLLLLVLLGATVSPLLLF